MSSARREPSSKKLPKVSSSLSATTNASLFSPSQDETLLPESGYLTRILTSHQSMENSDGPLPVISSPTGAQQQQREEPASDLSTTLARPPPSLPIEADVAAAAPLSPPTPARLMLRTQSCRPAQAPSSPGVSPRRPKSNPSDACSLRLRLLRTPWEAAAGAGHVPQQRPQAVLGQLAIPEQQLLHHAGGCTLSPRQSSFDGMGNYMRMIKLCAGNRTASQVLADMSAAKKRDMLRSSLDLHGMGGGGSMVWGGIVSSDGGSCRIRRGSAPLAAGDPAKSSSSAGGFSSGTVGGRRGSCLLPPPGSPALLLPPGGSFSVSHYRDESPSVAVLRERQA